MLFRSNAIVLGPDLATVQSKSNTTTNVPFPSGGYIPVTTNPVPIHHSAKVYAGATTTATNTRITVWAVYCND